MTIEGNAGGAVEFDSTTSGSAVDTHQASVIRAPKASKIRRFGPWAVPIALVILCVVFESLNRQFLSLSNLQTIVGTVALPSIVAGGLTITLVVNQFDLSIEAIAGFATIAVAVLNVSAGIPIIFAILITLVLGMLIGLVNGLFVGYLGLAALVVTIGMQSLLQGFQFTISPSSGISSGISLGFVNFARSGIAGIPTVFVMALGILLLLWIILTRTRLGREMRAVGGSIEAARYAGLNVRRITLIAFVITALTCAAAGVLFTGQQANVYPLQGLTVLLQSYAACFIGATMFRVGEFNIWGTAVGCVLAQVISNGLLLVNVSSYTVYFFQGGILISAVLLARLVIGASRTV